MLHNGINGKLSAILSLMYKIDTEMKYGSSFNAYIACKNTAKLFEVAVPHFVNAHFCKP